MVDFDAKVTTDKIIDNLYGKGQPCKECKRLFVPIQEGQKYCTVACATSQFPIVGYIKIPR